LAILNLSAENVLDVQAVVLNVILIKTVFSVMQIIFYMVEVVQQNVLMVIMERVKNVQYVT